jgi:hypothetical protein
VAESRKPLIVLAVLVVLAIVVYVSGAVGAARNGGGDGWTNPFGSLNVGDRLDVSELAVADGNCNAGEVITFQGACRLGVAPVTGGWPWQRVTRTLRLVGAQGSVKVALAVQGKTLRTDLDPGDDVRLTFTRDGGDLVLACLAVGGCTVGLAADGPR